MIKFQKGSNVQNYSIRGLVLNMTEVLRRYKMILIILGLSLVIAFLTFAIFVQKPEKVPSRGIFVFENTTDEKSFIKVLTEKHFNKSWRFRMQKTMTNKEYQAYVEKKTPNSKTGRNVLRAF